MRNDEKKPFSNPEPRVHYALALWSALCAEHTIVLFEHYAPNDMRPRNALETIRAWFAMRSRWSPVVKRHLRPMPPPVKRQTPQLRQPPVLLVKPPPWRICGIMLHMLLTMRPRRHRRLSLKNMLVR